MIVKGKSGMMQDAAIIKNSDLLQLKSIYLYLNMFIGGLRDVTGSKKEESIYSLGIPP